MNQFTPGMNVKSDAAGLTDINVIKARIEQTNFGVKDQQQHRTGLLKEKEHYESIEYSIGGLMESQTFAPASALMETLGIAAFKQTQLNKAIDQANEQIDGMMTMISQYEARLKELKDVND